ncbi:LapA family protein [Actinomadura barringtoniae]|uniref:LapA family protein n=1 Tax=Actinomadura barringtoniae TaxID=1427535 RepID=A0A939T8E5_9ACTN|nr:LapA family protein [Actinomadura barringtoniae]MBO2446830.1 LapA family protein [Actinomadura barringtoniae]
MTEQTTKPATGRGGMLGKVPTRAWVAIALAVLVLVFIFQNRQNARVHFLFVSVTSPMWTALLIAAGVGVLIGILAAGRRKSG